MAIPQIQLTIHDIQMDYSIRAPQIDILQRQAELHIEQPAAIIDITAKQATLHIDQSQAFAEAGLKPISQMISEYASKGKQAALQSIARNVQEGEQLQNGAGKGQRAAVIQSIAAQNTKVGPPQKSNITFIPSPGAVKINFTPGEFNIDIQAQQPKIDVQTFTPQIDLTYGAVTGTMTQRPSVEVHV